MANRIEIQPPIKSLKDLTDFHRLALVVFLDKVGPNSRVSLYPCFIFSYKDIRDLGSLIQVQFPDGATLNDRSAEFFAQEKTNAVYSGGKFIVINSFNELQCYLGTLKLDAGSARTNWLREQIESSPGGLAYSEGSSYLPESHLVARGVVEIVKGHKVTLRHTLAGAKPLPADSNSKAPLIMYWVKSEWVEAEPYADEINFSLNMSFGQDIPLNNFSMYIICPDGFELKASSNYFYKSDGYSGRIDLDNFSLDRRIDHRRPEYRYYEEWGPLRIIQSEMYRARLSSDLQANLLKGVEGVEISLSFDNERSRSRRELDFAIFTVILGLATAFVPPMENIYVLRMTIPKTVASITLVAALLLFGYQVLYLYRRRKWNTWVGSVLTIAIVLYFTARGILGWLDSPTSALVLFLASVCYIVYGYILACFGAQGVLTPPLKSLWRRWRASH